MHKEPIAITENIKFVSTIVMVYLFLNSFPVNMFIFGSGLLAGMWVSNKYDTVPIMEYLQVDYHIKLTYNFATSIYKKYTHISDVLTSPKTSHKDQKDNTPVE